jgi:hypothetical protein
MAPVGAESRGLRNQFFFCVRNFNTTQMFYSSGPVQDYGKVSSLMRMIYPSYEQPEENRRTGHPGFGNPQMSMNVLNDVPESPHPFDAHWTPSVTPSCISGRAPFQFTSDEVRNARLYKTRLCTFGEACPYLKRGRCLFAHCPEEIRSRPPPPHGINRKQMDNMQKSLMKRIAFQQEYEEFKAMHPLFKQKNPTPPSAAAISPTSLFAGIFP